MDESKLIFLTGAPGSKWSAVSWVLSEALSVDKTDRTPDRLMVHKKAYNGVRHTGVYFGPGMELGHNFHRINELSKEEILSEIQKGWPEWDDTKYHIIRCHQFINNFDWLVRSFPTSRFVVVTRRPEQCVAGWMSVGGIDIPYPKYKDYYIDNSNAERLIKQEALLAQRAFWDHQMDTYVAGSGHFKRKFGLEITDEESDLAKYIRSLEGYMYLNSDPYAKLKHDVIIGYHNFESI